VTEPDTELIARAVALNDRAAFSELVLRHQSSVRNFLRHLLRGDAALADDLAQDTFVQAYRGISRYRGDSSFRSWLLGIAHNHYRNARRRALVRGEVRDTQGEPDAEAGEPHTRGADLRADLASALESLSADEQTAVHLFYHQGLSHPEIAAVSGWPLGTVKTHIGRGREKLRGLLSSWNPRT